jgi:hypothetical protein
MHKVDILDHHVELEDRVMHLEREKKALEDVKIALQQETATLRGRPEQSTHDELQQNLRMAEERARHLEEQVRSVNGRADLPSVVADLGFKMEDLQQSLSEKDRRISDLETTNQSLSKGIVGERSTFTSKIRGLERTVAEQHKTFRTIQAERDQLRQLIHTEFRRTANELQNRQHPAMTLLERKVEVDMAIAEVRRKAQEFLRRQKRRDEELDNLPSLRIQELEQEIDYHVKDIVLYKLDVKGYKKDLKRAQAKIQKMSEPSLLSTFAARETRPSVSSQSSGSTAPQFGMSSALSDGESGSALKEVVSANSSPTKNEREEMRERNRRLSVHAYTPSGSPRESPATSPRNEKKVFNFVGYSI